MSFSASLPSRRMISGRFLLLALTNLVRTCFVVLRVSARVGYALYALYLCWKTIFGPPAFGDFSRCPPCCAFHLWRHLLIDRRPASLLVGDLIRCGIRSTIQHLKFHQYDKRDHTQCSTSRENHQFQLSWMKRGTPLKEPYLSKNYNTIHALG